METVIKKQCKCSKCGEEGVAVIWHKITEHQREELENMSLFQWKCPKCVHVYKFLYPCYYINHEQKVIVRYLNEQKEWMNDIAVEGYLKRECDTIEEMAEKARVFTAKLNDQIMELLKLIIFAKLHVEDETVCAIYFYRKAEDGNLEFTIFRGEEPEGITVPFQMYSQVLEMSEGIEVLAEDKFYKVDGDWAGKIIAEDNK